MLCSNTSQCIQILNLQKYSKASTNAQVFMQMSNLTYNVLTFHAGTVDYKQEVDMRDLDEMKLMCTKPSTTRCEDEFAVRCSDLMRQNDEVMPTSQLKAIDLYGWSIVD